MQPEWVSQTDKAIASYQAGDLKSALSIAKDFHMGVSKPDRDAMRRAYECHIRPEFYRSIGFNSQVAIEHGREVFERLFVLKEKV